MRRIDRVEKIEEFMDVFFDTQLAVRPGRERNALLEVFDLKPIFNVEGEQNSLIRRIQGFKDSRDQVIKNNVLQCCGAAVFTSS